MKYTVKKNLHSDFSVMEIGKLPGRAYFIPYESKEKLKFTDIFNERYNSGMVEILSGDWDFKFYKKASAMPDIIDTKKIRFDTVHVPSVWQRTGYLPPVYLNCPYECKTKAPEVPADMPAAMYRKMITLDTVADTEIISFLGMSSNLSLYVNGMFVGYSEGSHNTAEFDITSLLHAGENEIIVLSWKWCNGTFLEAQDMFRENGIFRDVYLTHCEKTYLNDFQINSEKTENGYNVAVDCNVEGNTENVIVKASLILKGETVAEAQVEAEKNCVIDFGTLDVIEWNAEIPTVYELYITLENADGEIMTVRNITGFKTIEIKDAVFYFNGQPIKIKGINHHDTNQYRGYAMTLEDMKQDVEIMKSLNVNSVRTSHYPPDPFFNILADVYGLYIIDEADIETHGCGEMFDDVNHLSKNLKWAPRYVDRVARMYMRDRNRASIIMWSLGNESGGYQCHDKCYEWLKNTGTKIPVHYEGVVRTKRFAYDVISEMYTDTYSMEAMLEGKRKEIRDGNVFTSKMYRSKPFYLCEYCHAMGVGPGNMEEYWDIIYASDSFMGGCVWEWADHTVYHDGDGYPYRYTYGGDHGEKQHDGNFCVDGLMYSDRRPHTGALEMKECYRPVRTSLVSDKLYCFENTNRFRATNYLTAKWELLENGECVESGELNFNIAPMSAQCIEVNHKDIDETKDAHINFVWFDGEQKVAVEQIILNDVPYEYDIEIGSRIGVISDAGIVTINFENGEAKFDARTGELTDYTVNGTSLLNTVPAEFKGLQPNVFRALIDNDARQRDKYYKAGLDKIKTELNTFDVHVDDGEIKVFADYILKGKNKALYGATVQYTFSSLGAVEVEANLRVVGKNAPLTIPRFGVMAELPADFRNVRYYGRGTAENMPDFKIQSPVGIYEAKVEDMFEPYVFPQDSGNHGDTKWLEITNAEGKGVKIFAEDRFSFSIHPFTQNAIQKAKHQEDLCDMNTTVLSLDGWVRGIGSSSCGPDTREEYTKSAADGFTLKFTIIPIA